MIHVNVLRIWVRDRVLRKILGYSLVSPYLQGLELSFCSIVHASSSVSSAIFFSAHHASEGEPISSTIFVVSGSFSVQDYLVFFLNRKGTRIALMCNFDKVRIMLPAALIRNIGMSTLCQISPARYW